MYIGLLHTHKLVVTLFLIIYLIKLFLLLTNKEEGLASFTKKVKIPEMAISALFLITGIALLYLKGTINTMLIVKLVAVFASIPVAVIGFKRKNKLLATFAIILVVAAYGLAEMSKKPSKKEVVLEAGSDSTEQAYDPISHGKAIYSTYCVECHGENGAKGASGAKDLSKSILTEEEARKIINYGKNNMMKYEGILTEKEIQAVSLYVLKLRN